MNPDELDRLLLREPEIRPSSKFSSSVMAAVRREATAPPPIPFPWKLALPGLLACAVAIGWPLMEMIEMMAIFRTPAQESASVVTSTLAHTLAQTLMQWTDAVVPLLDKAQMLGAGWILLGLLFTFAGLKLTWRLAGGRV